MFDKYGIDFRKFSEEERMEIQKYGNLSNIESILVKFQEYGVNISKYFNCNKIKNILILRKLGLSVKQIQELQKQDKDLQSALYEKRAEIGALINTKLKEIALLDQALEQLHNADSIDGLSTKLQTVSQNSDLIEIISECNHAIVSGNTDLLYKHLSVTMKEYMPPSAYEKMRDDTMKPLGTYRCLEQLETDRIYPNVLHQYVRYEHLGLKIRYVFIDNKIHGLWLGYYILT